MAINRPREFGVKEIHQAESRISVADILQRQLKELKTKVSPSKNDNSWLGRLENTSDRPKKKTIINKSNNIWNKWYQHGKDSSNDNSKPRKEVILLQFTEASRVKGALKDDLNTGIVSSAQGEAKGRLTELVSEVMRARFPEQDISHMIQQERDALNEQVRSERTTLEQYIEKAMKSYMGESLENPIISHDRSSKRRAKVPDEWSGYFSKNIDHTKVLLEYREFVESLPQKISDRKAKATEKLTEVERELNTLRSQFMAMDSRDFSEAQGEGVIWEGRGRSETIKGNENLIAMNLHELQLQAFHAGKISNEMLNTSDKENSEHYEKLKEDFDTSRENFKSRVLNILNVHGRNPEGYEGPKNN